MSASVASGLAGATTWSVSPIATFTVPVKLNVPTVPEMAKVMVPTEVPLCLMVKTVEAVAAVPALADELDSPIGRIAASVASTM